MSVDDGFQYLQLDQRMYEYVRSTAITNITDALLELITNGIDAYTDIPEPVYPQSVFVTLNRTENKIMVQDNATGLDGERLEQCFLTVGSYTSSENKRGHFSRGAKDISAIGNITFSTIKNGLFSQCVLLDTALGKITYSNIPATDEHRDEFNLVGDGLCVCIDLTKITLTNWNIDNIRNHYALFDIYSNPNYQVSITDLTNETTEIMNYTQPAGTKILDIEYDLTRWNAVARFTLYTSMELPSKDNGILISSDNAIYQHDLLSPYIWRNSLSQRLFGRIHCSDINRIMNEYDEFGATKRNPFPLIEPSRLGGLHKKHPFFKELIAIPLRKIQYYFEECNYLKNRNSIKSVSDLFYGIQGLQDLGNSLLQNVSLDDPIVEDDFVPPDLQTLLEASIRSSSGRIRDLDENLDLSQKNIDTRISQEQDILNSDQNKVHIQMIEAPNKYHINYDSSGIYIDISKTHPAMEQYLGDKTEDEIASSLETTEMKILFSDIISEAFADIIYEDDVKNSDINPADYTTEQLLKIMDTKYWDSYNSIHPKLYNLLVKGIPI